MSEPTHISHGPSLEGGEGTYRFLQTEEEIMRGDLSIGNATFEGLVDFITSRNDVIIAAKDRCHLRVDTRNTSITLYMEEHGGHRHGLEEYVPSTTITASAAFSKNYAKAKALMITHRSPHDLFEKLREVPHLFNDAAQHADVLKVFRSVTFKLKKLLADTSTDSGEREKSLKLQFEEQPDAAEWQWLVPIYEGGEAELITVKTLYEANEAMNGVNIRLVNWQLEDIETQAAKSMLTKALQHIRNRLGSNIPFVFVN